MIDILMHTIGYNGVTRSTRNHFVTGDSGEDLEKCLEAVGRGYMIESTNKIHSSMIGGGRLFHATKDGIDFISANQAKPIKTTRSQRRYARYREYCDCFSSFKEFLAWDAEPERSWNQNKTA